MTFEAFKESVKNTTPPTDISDLALAMWHDARGDWEAAHNIAQDKEGTRAYDRLHAYLHRVEGDTWNAGYWYRRAGAKVFKGSLQEEWEELVRMYLK